MPIVGAGLVLLDRTRLVGLGRALLLCQIDIAQIVSQILLLLYCIMLVIYYDSAIVLFLLLLLLLLDGLFICCTFMTFIGYYLQDNLLIGLSCPLDYCGTVGPLTLFIYYY